MEIERTSPACTAARVGFALLGGHACGRLKRTPRGRHRDEPSSGAPRPGDSVDLLTTPWHSHGGFAVRSVDHAHVSALVAHAAAILQDAGRLREVLAAHARARR